jgi:tetratricopeptide (TPR) repeat protein
MKINPNAFDLWGNKAVSLSGLERFKDAATCYKQAVSLNPTAYIIWMSKALIEEKAGMVQEAIQLELL